MNNMENLKNRLIELRARKESAYIERMEAELIYLKSSDYFDQVNREFNRTNEAIEKMNQWDKEFFNAG